MASWCAAAIVIAGLGGVMTPTANARTLVPSNTQVGLFTKVTGDRINATAKGITPVAGAVLQLTDLNGNAVAECTSDVDGDCTFLVEKASLPNTATVKYYVSTLSAPAGWADATPAENVYFSFDRADAVSPGPALKGYNSTGSVALARANPTLPATCGQNALKVAFVADLSGSMNDPVGNPAIKTMKDIAMSYVDALAQTDAQIALFTFSDHSPATGTNNYPLTPANTGASQLKSLINGWSASGLTNYDEAFWKVATYTDKFDFVIFLSDGAPSTSTGGNVVVDSIASANAVKLKGIRIIGVGVGPEFGTTSFNFISAISGPKTGNANPAANDYFMASDWASVAGIFQSLATVCTASTVEVKFMDDITGNEVAPLATFDSMLFGMPGSPLTFVQADAEKGFDTKKYDFVSMNTIDSFTKNPQTITVHLTHKMNTSNVDVTRTIHYTGAGDATPPDSVSKVTWTKTTDAVTEVSQCTTTDEGYPEVVSPPIGGYTVDKPLIPAQPVTLPPATCPPPNSETTVTYTLIPSGSVNVVFVDDVTGNEVAGKAGFNTVLTGQSGTPVGFTEDDAKAGVDTSKYVYVNFENVSTFTVASQTIKVHVTHATTTADVPVTRTIHYQGAGPSTPTDVKQTINWTRTTDLATSTTQCVAAAEQYDAVPSPAVTGYTVDPGTVPAASVASPANTCPANTTVTVTYTVIPTKIQIVFYDDDSKAQVSPSATFNAELSGNPGDTVSFTDTEAEAGFNTGIYQIARIDNVSSFTFADQTITVHLTHKKSIETVNVTRTITYSGAGDKTPAAVVQTIPWTMTTDLVTNVPTCTTTATNYPAVTTPSIDYYIPSRTEVPALAVTTPPATCPPANISESVTYTPVPDAYVYVVFYDDIAEKTVSPAAGFTTTLLTGKPGQPVGFTVAQAQSGVDTSKYVY
ncbi:MAG: VWA domain-containing protein, partial [Propionibacteriaceae bacterium]|nr:VWA domain-containing protein [Propionibacteriaceae bacterium]